MKTKLLVLASICFGFLNAQTTADFESFNLGVDSFLNGSDLQGGFTDGNIFLGNEYDATWQSWSGFSISTITDNYTPGYTNDLSAITGMGNNGSLTYATTFMSYTTNSSILEMTGNAAGKVAEGMYVTNSTYAYLSMLDGDAVAKKFGGASGDEPDFFLLTIQKYLNGSLQADKIEFYLADYRFADNADDYIVGEWTYIDLTSLGNADSISFSLSSSDVGQFGMNTPAYFCFDDFKTTDELATGIKDMATLGLSLYPNPTKDVVVVQNAQLQEGVINVYNNLGQEVYTKALQGATETVSLQGLPAGAYLINVALSNGERSSNVILKQ